MKQSDIDERNNRGANRLSADAIKFREWQSLSKFSKKLKKVKCHMKFWSRLRFRPRLINILPYNRAFKMQHIIYSRTETAFLLTCLPPFFMIFVGFVKNRGNTDKLNYRRTYKSATNNRNNSSWKRRTYKN